MKNIRLLILLVNLIIVTTISAQNTQVSVVQTIDGKKYLQHLVQSGETIFSICKKYEVEQKDLLGANPNLVTGLKQGESIRIPFKGKDISKEMIAEQQKLNEKFFFHNVKKTETVYSITKLYNLTDKELYRYNPEAQKGINEKDVLRIPKSAVAAKTETVQKDDENYIYYKVQPGDTAFSLAQKYKTTVDELDAQNPGIKQKLEVGATIRIPKKALVPKPDTKMNGVSNPLIHTVEKGETFYSIKKKYGISKDDLIKLNPEVADGLKVGLELKIPASKKQVASEKKQKAVVEGQHVVKKGQTWFGIAQIYGVEEEALRKNNPDVKGGKLKLGDVLLIPAKVVVSEKKPDVSKEEVKQVKQPEPEAETPVAFSKKTTITRKETFRISMFLPLFYNKNISSNQESLSDDEKIRLDSLRKIDDDILNKYFKIVYNSETSSYDTVITGSVVPIYERSLDPDYRKFLEFYEGALIAIDSLQKAGAKIELTLYDTEFDAKKVDVLMRDPKLLNSNLIIGPVEVSLQKNMAAFCHKNQIAMVSPLSNDNSVALGNPFYIQINPAKDYIIKKTADLVVERFKGKNIVVLNHWGSDKVKEAKMIELVREKLSASGMQGSIHGVEYSAGGAAGSAQIEKGLKRDVENVVLVAVTENRDEREAFLSRAINNLYALSKEYNITLIGMSDYLRLKSINGEYFHKLNMTYLTPNHIDYTGNAVNSFVRKYRKEFAGEPTFFSFRGYDVVWYFVKAFDVYGRNYFERIGNYSTDLLMSDFDFSRIKELGGYLNNSLYIVNHTPEFDVLVQSKFSDGKLVKVLPEN